jgi:peptide/nickel transport system substrate-binding protein
MVLRRRHRGSPLAALALLLTIGTLACQPAAPAPAREANPGGSARPAAGPTRVVIAGTTSVESANPYVGVVYGLWCEVYGCLVSYDFKRGDYAGLLAQSWQVESPTTWVFHLRPDARWSDGAPFTAADVVHSVDRARHDPVGRARLYASPIVVVEPVDDHTVRFHTKEPTSSLLDYLKSLVITSKAQYDQFGEEVWRETPLGTGPYQFRELLPDRHLVIAKDPQWWGGTVAGPDEVILRVLREPEVRVTALLNNEVQIALNVPPHMVERVRQSPHARVVSAPGAEMVILGMNVKLAPWDNKLLRQAVGYALDRDGLIQGVLMGQARRLDGPIGPDQYGYDPNLQSRYPYDPERARQLVTQAGFPNGVDVELCSPVGRYPLDKQVVEAIAPMLTAVGIRTRVLTPEWPSLFSDINAGKVPFYYLSRTSVVDPGVPLSQYFETGQSRRTGYSNPQVDGLFARERATFDPAERKQVLAQLMSTITDEAPAQFLFQQEMARGVARNVEFEARPDEYLVPSAIRVK